MQALFFVEPFPVRNSMTHFRDIGKRAAQLCAGDEALDLRIFGNTETLEILSNEFPDFVRRHLLWPTSEEEAFFRSQMLAWEVEGLQLWSEYMQGGPVSERYIEVLERLRHEFPFDLIVHWGENRAINRFAEERDLTHIGLELGCSRKPFLSSYIFDPFGTNGAALAPRLTIRQIDEIVEGRETSAEAAVLGCAEDDACRIYDSRFDPLPTDLAEKLLRTDRKIALLALQLFDDANLILFSDYRDVRDVVSDVVPKLAAAGYLVVIKPHPASHVREGARQENAIARSALQQFRDDVVWLDEANSSVTSCRLMQLADLVVTVNSSVGFEALYFDKTVVVLGQAVYKPAGLFPDLDEVVNETYDRDAYLRNIGLLRTFFFEAYLVQERWLSEAQLFAHRLSTIAAVQRRFPNDPFAAAKALFAAFSPGERTLRQRRTATGTVGTMAEHALAAKPGTKGRSIKGRCFHDGPQLRSLVKALQRASGSCDPSEIKLWLTSQWQDLDSRTNALRLLGAVDESWYLEKYPPVKEKGLNAVENFSKVGEAGGRVPSPIVDSRAYSSLPAPRYLNALLGLLENAELKADVPPAPLSDEELATLQAAKVELARLLERPKRGLAVVAHLYYADLVNPLLDRLRTIPEPFDLIATVPMWGNRSIVETVRSRFPDATCLSLPNRGRDVAPFLFALPALIERDYDAVLKIQTKKGFYQGGRLKSRLGSTWREYSWRCLAGSGACLTDILAKFRGDEPLTMVGPSELLVRARNFPIAMDEETKRVIGIDGFTAEDLFFAGTMFWMKPSHFERLATSRFAFDAFSADPENSNGQLEHLIERLLGHVAQADGGRMAVVEMDRSTGATRLDTSLVANARPLSVVMESLCELVGA